MKANNATASGLAGNDRCDWVSRGQRCLRRFEKEAGTPGRGNTRQRVGAGIVRNFARKRARSRLGCRRGLVCASPCLGKAVHQASPVPEPVGHVLSGPTGWRSPDDETWQRLFGQRFGLPTGALGKPWAARLPGTPPQPDSESPTNHPDDYSRSLGQPKLIFDGAEDTRLTGTRHLWLSEATEELFSGDLRKWTARQHGGE